MNEISRATPNDAGAIAAVHAQAWRAAYRGLLPDDLLDCLSIEGRTTMWQELMRADGTSVYVARRSRLVVGFCAVATPARGSRRAHR